MLAVLALAAASAASGQPRGEVIVYAATSLREVLTGLTPACEQATGARLVFTFGPSNELARRILAGRTADLFFPADELWMDHLASAGLVDRATRRTVVSNRLVVVAPSTGEETPATLGSPEQLAGEWLARLSIGEPFQVPVGRYARAWLTRAGIWETLAGRLAPAPDSRAVLAAVESGAASAGIVYRTDAARSKKVKVIFEVVGPAAPAIAYPLAMLTERPHRDGPAAVAAWLSGLAASPAFAKAGFGPPGGGR